MVAVFGSALAEVSVDEYAVKQVFDDKPGLGWMLYLPKILAPQQTPEARVLIPVPEKGKQTGTIIVSVTDAPFSVDNPDTWQSRTASRAGSSTKTCSPPTSISEPCRPHSSKQPGRPR